MNLRGCDRCGRDETHWVGAEATWLRFGADASEYYRAVSEVGVGSLTAPARLAPAGAAKTTRPVDLCPECSGAFRRFLAGEA